MRKVLLFVHGTGVRRIAYDVSYELIKKQLTKHQCEVSLQECYWGGDFGVQQENFQSVPTYANTRNIDDDGGDEVLALWNLLSQEPTFELGVLPLGGEEAEAYALHEESPVTLLERQFAELADNADLCESIEKLGLKQTADAILQQIICSPAFRAVNASDAAATLPHRVALARAAVAMLQYLALEAGTPVFDGASRDELVNKLARSLGADVRGMWDALLLPLTWYGRARRGKLTDRNYAAAGDILRYQFQGSKLRMFLRDKIALFPNDQVIILAHSLGGIAAFETLLEYKPSNVALLITYGSQAAFLYEIDALACLRRTDKLPAKFPPWSNFYDLNDPLSYLARELFDKRVSDDEVQSGQPFPASHSAYLHSTPFWQLVTSKINRV